jgi:type I restriction-modification system DNA methylase subunit
MILHGVNYSNFDIRQEDTLEKPQHLDKTFDAIVAIRLFLQNGVRMNCIFWMKDFHNMEN